MTKQQNIQIDPNGSAVTVEVLIGHAQLGESDHHLYDHQGQHPGKEGDGNSLQLPTQASQLVGRPLLTRTIVQNLGGANSAFSVTTTYKQDALVRGEIQSVGNFAADSNEEPVFHVARFV